MTTAAFRRFDEDSFNIIWPAGYIVPPSSETAPMTFTRRLVLLAMLLTAPQFLFAADLDFVPVQPRLELNKGDHVAYVGNTLADRMQHFGWLETLIQSRFPDRELVFRNLGFSADELTVRPRSANFGTPDEHLTRVQADVIFAFFGYNESFAGEAGLPAFKKNLREFIDHARKQKYNGESAPRIVLFSSIAHENLNDRHLPDGSENNQRLAMYTKATAEVAKEKGIAFVDLFGPTKLLYEKTDEPLTINGIHLNARGQKLVAEIIDRRLFGPQPVRNAAFLETLRESVLDKNLHWFNVYRTTDGYSVFGGRSTLKFVDGQTNREVMQRELEILEVMTANRDKRVHARASGKDLNVNDDNTPAPVAVQTNLPGKGEGGKHLFLEGEYAIERMTVEKGYEVNLFASEERFPELVNPVQSAVDPDGRLWVAAWPTYPHWNPNKPLNDKLLILTDDNGDGRADRCITFADGLHNPTGFEFYNGGVLLAQAPDILFLKDTDGDGKADVRERILHGIDSADTHHTANSFVVGPAGNLYFQRGVFHVSNTESPWGKPFRSTSTGLYRYDPKRHTLDMHFGVGPNPHGDVFNKWGFQFVSDGTSGNGFYVGFPGRGAPKTLYVKRVRPVPAIGILSSDHFPRDKQGNLLILNVIGFQGVAQYEFKDEGAGFHAEEIEPLLVSSDPNFRPSDLEIGGDGALYVLDWHNPLIGHMQHNLRDPSRDHQHGRVYRVTAKGRPLMKPVKMGGKPIPEILAHLTSDTNSVRYRARLELSGRKSEDVAAAAATWAEQFDEANPDHALPLVEALWLHQQHRLPNVALLKRVLNSKEPHARAAAVRVLRDWLKHVDDAGELLVKLAGDEHPRVRAEALVAAVALQNNADDAGNAAEVVFEASKWATDQQLAFVLNEAKKSIDVDRHVRQTLAVGKKLSPRAEAYALRNADVDDLLKMERTEAVYEAILIRENVPVEHLRTSLSQLAEARKKSELNLLLSLIEDLNRRDRVSSVSSLSRLLAEQPANELRGRRDQLKTLAETGKSADTRRVAYAAWITADGSGDAAFAHAARSKQALREALEAVSLVADDKARAKLYTNVQPLLSDLPDGLKAESGGSSLEQRGIHVDYFHPSAQNVAVETLAKMDPKASGVVPEITMNVPQRKEADRFALRFSGSIRIEEPGEYTFFTRSDDGSRLYIGDELVVNNDGLHGMAEKNGRIALTPGLHPITVTYFDNGGGDGLEVSWAGPGFKKQPIPGNRLSVTDADTVHDIAVRTLASIPGREADKFRELTALVNAGRNVNSAVAALKQIPDDKRPKDALADLAAGVVAYVASVPTKYRTNPSVLDAISLAESVSASLPSEKGAAIRSRLEELKVRIIPIGTVPHRMIYDKEKIVVQAGSTVEFAFSNSDQMPHNFAIVEPGSLEEVGLLAEKTAREPDAIARQYIPETDRVLVGSRLLQPQQSQRIGFVVPSKPGIYPYVCTFPGHWRRMYGALYVVEDVKAYNADPEKYLAAHPLERKDELLKYLSRDTDWKYEDLASDVAKLGHGRSFEVGRQLFKIGACVSCHRVNNEGRQIGADLAKLDPKRTPTDVLRDVIEPSKRVEEKYQSNTFVLASGKLITGLVLKEDKETVTIVDNPLAPDKPVVIKKSEIDDRKKSAVSIMPKGVLNKFTREEILDLIAYVYARGNPKHQMYEMHKH